MKFRWPFYRDRPTAIIAAPASAPRSDGFFSTSVLPPRHTDDLAEWRREIARTVFQRTPSNLIRADGVALDSADCDWSDGGFGITGFGYSGVPAAQAAWFGAQSFIGYQMCAILAQHWLIDKVCTGPARDAIRKGYEISGNDGTDLDPKVIDYIRQIDKKFKVAQNCAEAVRFMRIYGVRVVLFVVESPDDHYYEKPFNPDGIKPGSYKGISQVDPYWITPELDAISAADPASIHFYEPTYWRIAGKRYHRTHLVVLKTCDPPDVLKPTYFYGGIPLTQRIYERVYAAERTANEAPQLALTKRTNVIHVDLAAAAANQVALTARLDDYAFFRDNYGVKVVGTEETMEQFETSLADLDSAIMTQYQLVAAIGDYPATKLLGTTPKGFNSTGEYEEANYHEMLESVQAHDMSPIVERHHLLAIRSWIAPKFGLAPFSTSVEWNELDAETAMESATRRKTDADATKALVDTGAIDGTDVRDKLIADKDSGWSGLSPIKPEGAAPKTVVQPDAPLTAPNTPPGDTPTPAPAGAAGSGGSSGGTGN